MVYDIQKLKMIELGPLLSIITLNVKYIKLSKQKAEICTMDTMLSTRHFLSKTQTD